MGPQNVVILSKTFKPTQVQLHLLNKGLSYIPTYKIHENQKQQLTLDLQIYHRRLKLAAFFEGKENPDLLPFMPKSEWVPKDSQLPRTIRHIIRADKYALSNLHWENRDPLNLSSAETLALKELQSYKHIVLKPADKGSSIVIMDRSQYVWEAERQLNNPEHYKKLKEPIFQHTIPLVEVILENLQKENYINLKQKTYLKGPGNPRPRLFYLLPKIHKDPCTWPKPFEIPPGRPIVSDCNSETYYTAEFIEYYLNPLSNRHCSYIKDTFDFLDKIKNLKIPTNSFLFTMDINSLYTNIDTVDGLDAVKKCFRKFPDPSRPDEWLIELLKINLTRNDFEFNSKFYLQVKGTAMGKRFAPSYANIFMAHWEETALAVCPLKPLHYFRFLDDIWGIWIYTKNDFETFFQILNQHHKSIRLTYNLDSEKVTFLDTVIFKGPDFEINNHLSFKVHFKDTDTHALLFKSSFHPKHTFRGIVKSQLLRFSRICSQEEHFWEATNTLFRVLRTRGYSRSFLRRCLRSFRVPRAQGAEKRELLPLVTTYSTISSQLNHLIKTNFVRFTKDTRVLQKSRVISAFRRNRNLQDILVHSKLSPPPQSTRNLCAEYQHKKWIRNHKTKQIFKISSTSNCKTKNCIYLIFCIRCGSQYVGETKNSIITRLYQHRYNIRQQKETGTYLVKHFLAHGLQCLRIMVLQHNSLWTTNQRKHFEHRWIDKLGTKFPYGLNEQ